MHRTANLNKSHTDYLVFDMSNLLYRVFYANKQEDTNTIAGLAHHSALMTLNKYFKKYKPRKKVVMCFDRSSWRKKYTASDKCVSKRPYKGHRRQQMTPSEKEKYQSFLQHLGEFEDIMRTQTAIVCLSHDGFEADDFAALFTFKYSDDNIVIISGDKDYIQLINDRVTVVDPMSGKQRSLQKWDNNKSLFLMEKCFRGDQSDNIQSAYPRLRKTEIIKAINDPFVFNNLLNHEWTNPHGITFKVKDLYKENQLLMDLSKLPEDMKSIGYDVIEYEMNNPGSFSYFHFLRFCGQYQLKRISESLESFIPMLNL